MNDKNENLDVAAPAGRDFSSSFNTPPAGGAGGATTAPSIANGRYVNSAEDLVFLTNTDESDYPIYITSQREVWHKKKPADVALSIHASIKPRRSGYSTYESFYSEDGFREAARNLQLSEVDERLQEAAKAVLELGDSASKYLSVYDIEYELYAGDYERLLGTFKALAVKVFAESKFRCLEKQAWAISFEWEKRIKAKHPNVAKYVYAKAAIGRRNYARVIVKIPFAPKELDEVLNRVLASAVAAQTSPLAELEEQVKKLEELIRQREQELQALREQLAQLQLKLQLEQMKRQVIE